MTKLLEKTMAVVSELPEQEQDSLAAIILEELSSERRWNETFAGSQKQLATLADEALAEFKQGKTEPLEI